MYAQPPKKLHRILIIEDDPTLRWTLAVLFQRHGVETDVAETGREAVRLLLLQPQYCVVLVDLNIPPPDGIELARFVRDHCPETPVVVISGYPDLIAKMNSEALGKVVRLILMKPVDTSYLVRYVHGDHFCIRDSPPHATPPRTDLPAAIPVVSERPPAEAQGTAAKQAPPEDTTRRKET